jgi:hypothetical protein
LYLKGSAVRTFFLSAFLVFLSACGGGGNGGGGVGSSSQSSISVSSVKQMMVAPVGATSASLISLESLYALTLNALGIQSAWAANSNSQVYSVDLSGDISVSNLANLVSGSSSLATSDLVIDSPKFLLFRYVGLYQPVSAAVKRQCVLLGVRKTDGKFACILSNPRCDAINICAVNDFRSQIKVDPSGNVFFIVLGDGGLEKVDVSDPANPIYSKAFTHSEVGDASVPVVNQNAEVMTSINLMSSSTDIETRIYSGSTLKYTVSRLEDVKCAFVGPGLDASNFYYTSFETGPGFSLNKLTRGAAGDFTKSTVNTNLTGSNGLDLGNTSCARVVHTSDKVFAVGYRYGNSPRNFLYELVNSSGTPTFHTLTTDFLYQTALLSYQDTVVVVGTDITETSHGIQKFDSLTNTFTTVLPVGTFKIGSTTISQSGEITFTGTRLSSGSGVIGTISSAGILTAKNISVEPTSIASVK